MFSFRPRYQDWWTREKVEWSKRLSTLMAGKILRSGRKRKIPRIYWRGSPWDLLDTICSRERPGCTALCIHLNSLEAWLLPNDEERMVNRRGSMTEPQGRIGPDCTMSRRVTCD